MKIGFSTINIPFSFKRRWHYQPNLSACIFLFLSFSSLAQNKIDRKALVERHKVIIHQPDSLSSLSVGNGAFAFTVDVTGLQSFPEYYKSGVPLGTESEWGWHSFLDTSNFRFEETLKNYFINGRNIPYSVQWSTPERNKAAANWFRQNPHRLQLGNIGFQILKKDGSLAAITDLKNINQELNPWTGEIKSYFEVEGTPVSVSTFSHQHDDLISVRATSDLIAAKRLKVFIRFPYPTGDWADVGVFYQQDEKHISKVINQTNNSATILHQLDSTKYYVSLLWAGSAIISSQQPHNFTLEPRSNEKSLEYSFRFSTQNKTTAIASYTQTKASSELGWKQFWTRGGAIDFSGSTDKRANELERRIILSQYLTKIQCAGNFPTQETGLTYNSWYGKPHLEMHWWHAVHFALWGRIDLLEKSLDWYATVFSKAKEIAARQGFEGVRWQKMTDPQGEESPSSVGAFLIWQQPHFIYFAELCYREHKDKKTLEKYKDLVFATADFMASYPFYDAQKKQYILGKGLIPAQERFKPEETFNPTFELSYWRWALQMAQQWRIRCRLQRNEKWDDVINKLSPLPVKDGVYLSAESAPDSYTNKEYETDHPSVLAALGFLPGGPWIKEQTMQQTFTKVWNTWQWNDTWGWDFPMTAMTATRLHMPDKAIDALLMNITTNTYLANGHNYQDNRLRIYLPGNGGLLTAIAMMCAGYDGANQTLPGIPKNGAWKVRWEGLKKMP